MSKRAPQFRRRARDWYPSPPEVAAPLLRHLPPGATYWEPCAGDGALCRALAPHARCVAATDIEPQAEGIYRLDAMSCPVEDIEALGVDYIITNPMWPRPGGHGEPVVSLALHLSGMRPTWLLLPFDFAANAYFGKVASVCTKVIPIGRVSWMGNGQPGKDNAAWFCFDAKHIGRTTLFPRLKLSKQKGRR